MKFIKKIWNKIKSVFGRKTASNPIQEELIIEQKIDEADQKIAETRIRLETRLAELAKVAELMNLNITIPKINIEPSDDDLESATT